MTGSLQRLEDRLFLVAEQAIEVEHDEEPFGTVDDSGDALLGCAPLGDARRWP